MLSSQAVAFSIPVLASVLAFVVYALTGHDLNPATIFTSLALFNLLRQPLMFMPRALSAITDGRNALSRISLVFQADTLNTELLIEEDLPDALIVQNAGFKWEDATSHGGAHSKAKKNNHNSVALADAPADALQEPFSLANISLSIPRGGKIHAIVGSIGSGKSSLLNGEIAI